MTIELVSPRIELEEEYLGMIVELERAGETYWFFAEARRDFAGYLQKIDEYARSERLPYGIVPYHTFWLVRDETRVLGQLHLRHRLTAALAIEGGHIGYNIRPSERRKGYGTLQLRLGLEKAHGLGLTHVLVTCDDDNLPSAKIIEANGGVLSGRAVSPESGVLVRQYWIEV
jgi:predicted acetyltransferase